MARGSYAINIVYHNTQWRCDFKVSIELIRVDCMARGRKRLELVIVAGGAAPHGRPRITVPKRIMSGERESRRR